MHTYWKIQLVGVGLDVLVVENACTKNGKIVWSDGGAVSKTPKCSNYCGRTFYYKSRMHLALIFKMARLPNDLTVLDNFDLVNGVVDGMSHPCD